MIHPLEHGHHTSIGHDHEPAMLDRVQLILFDTNFLVTCKTSRYVQRNDPVARCRGVNKALGFRVAFQFRAIIPLSGERSLNSNAATISVWGAGGI